MRRSVSMRWNRVGLADPVSIVVVGGMVLMMAGIMIGMGWMMSRMMKHGGQGGSHGAMGQNQTADSSHSGMDMGGMGTMGMMGMGHMMGGMGDKISEPTTDEARTILDYLKHHALASVSPETLPDGPAEGRKAFLDVCVRCHALPDPAQHVRDEWPAVLDRMHQNMTAMKVEPPAQETWEKAREYLLSVAPAVSDPARPPAHQHEGGVPPCCGAP